MPKFYKNLAQLEQLLEHCLTIDDLNDGLIRVNGHLIDTNQQLEMLTPDFFTGTAAQNPTINAYKLLFQNMGILPENGAQIPIIRDIPLRTASVDPQIATQQQMFAQFLERDILTNQWSMLFPEEYRSLRSTIAQSFKKEGIAKKMVVFDAEGQRLASGGYEVTLHSINGMQLWLNTPEGGSEKDISAAIDRCLADTENTNTIVNHLKPKLLTQNRIAFNVRGVSKSISSREEIQNTPLGGGHQNFLMLDRTTKTIYAINDTRGATDEDPKAFKQQIQLFLNSLGDKNNYKFEFIQGKSRQPAGKSYLRQACSISQFCHYAAILSGVNVRDIQDTVPAKISTLMYLLQYASINKDRELYAILDQIITKIKEQIAGSNPVAETKKVTPKQRPKPNDSLPENESLERDAKLQRAKNLLGEHVLLQVINRLELGSKSYNPYWFNSQKKLDRIVDCLLDAEKNGKKINRLLANSKSHLSQAVNMHRLPQFCFFSMCLGSAEVKSRDIIKENTKKHLPS